jgi:thiol:disulfide interchange protein DsbD
MKIRHPLLVAACALLATLTASAQLPVVGDGGPGPVKTQHLTAELVTATSAIAPGGTLQAGLVLTLEPHWHVYWINAGDSGEPPHIKWTLPPDITAGSMQFPIPSRLPLGPLMDFGYENVAAFPVELTAAKSAKTGPVHLDANVSWLVCREVCIPGKAHLGLNLTVTPGAATAQPTGPVADALNLIPRAAPSDVKFTVMGGKTDFVLTLITGHNETNAEFYPFDQDQIANAAAQTIEPLPNGVRLRVKRSEDLTQLPAQLHGVLKLSSARAYDVTASVIPGEVAVATGLKPGKSASGITTITAIGLAFLGGIILNLMPCVFPVLFLKGLALVQSSGEERGRLRSHGLVYTLGILVSFWIIVAVLLGLRAGGAQAGWGFQLQSPTFLAILASSIFFFALSLAGQFDIGLSFTSVGGELAQKQGLTGSFFTGVLATIVATPCTAPLMGAAIGFALAQPAGITFAVFTALGLGLATPYLLLSFQPAWTRVLPRPGAWMEVFKQLTAVVFFATVIWLTYVYGSLFATGASGGQGVYRVALLLGCFLLIAVAGWILGRWPARWPSTIAAVLVAVIGLTLPLYQPKDTNLVWQPYSQQALDQARASGHPVFIDFTAAWCLSCQVNERLVLRSADVQHEFADRKLTLLKADWTQYDPEITKELASLNRSGVPTYVIYPASPTASADVLPELLTKDVVLTAIAKDVR